MLYSFCLLLSNAIFLNPKKITITVSGTNITFNNFFKDGTSYIVTVKEGVMGFTEKGTMHGESHTLIFSDIKWDYITSAGVIVISWKIVGFKVLIDGKEYNYKSLYIADNRYYSTSGESVETGANYQFYAMNAQGDVSWSITKNISGGTINNNGLYTAGQPIIVGEYDQITATDSKYNSDVVYVWVTLKTEIVDSIKCTLINSNSLVFWANNNLWIYSNHTIYKFNSKSMPVDSIKTPFERVNGITYDGNYIWVLGVIISHNESFSGFKVYDTTGILKSSFAVNEDFNGLAYGNNSLWTTKHNEMEEDEIIKLDNFGHRVNTYKLPIGALHLMGGIAFHQNYFWVTRGMGIYKIDMDMNFLTYAKLNFFDSGLTWDDQNYIWMICPGNQYIYKIVLYNY